jgi:hypothetical protein
LYTPRSNEEIMLEKETALIATKLRIESELLNKTKKTK